MRIVNQTRQTQLASNARVARTFWSRLMGLMGKPSFPAGQALIIDPCTSVHTWFMRFAIDVLYVRDERVVKVVPDLKPFRVSALWRGGGSVIELPAGVIATTGTAAGDELSYES